MQLFLFCDYRGYVNSKYESLFLALEKWKCGKEIGFQSNRLRRFGLPESFGLQTRRGNQQHSGTFTQSSTESGDLRNDRLPV